MRYVRSNAPQGIQGDPAGEPEPGAARRDKSRKGEQLPEAEAGIHVSRLRPLTYPLRSCAEDPREHGSEHPDQRAHAQSSPADQQTWKHTPSIQPNETYHS